MIVAPISLRGSWLRDNKEDNEKRRKQDEKRLEIQCIIHLDQQSLSSLSLNFVKKKNLKNDYKIILLIYSLNSLIICQSDILIVCKSYLLVSFPQFFDKMYLEDLD